jgi:hypothetical protein
MVSQYFRMGLILKNLFIIKGFLLLIIYIQLPFLFNNFIHFIFIKLMV